MVRRLQNKDSNTTQNYRMEVYSFVLKSRQLCIYPIKNSLHCQTFIDVRIKEKQKTIAMNLYRLTFYVNKE